MATRARRVFQWKDGDGRRTGVAARTLRAYRQREIDREQRTCNARIGWRRLGALRSITARCSEGSSLSLSLFPSFPCPPPIWIFSLDSQLNPSKASLVSTARPFYLAADYLPSPAEANTTIVTAYLTIQTNK